MENILEFCMQEKFKENLDSIHNDYLQNCKSIDAVFIESFKEVFKKAIKLQQEEKKGDIEYILISFLRTHIMEDDYRFRIDLYDNSFFLDRVECSGYWDIHFIFQYIQEDMEFFKEMVSQYTYRVEEYEFDLFKKEYATGYSYVAYEYLAGSIEQILKMKEYQCVNKSEKIKIYFGEYMDKADIIYDQEANGQEAI